MRPEVGGQKNNLSKLNFWKKRSGNYHKILRLHRTHYSNFLKKLTLFRQTLTRNYIITTRKISTRNVNENKFIASQYLDNYPRFFFEFQILFSNRFGCKLLKLNLISVVKVYLLFLLFIDISFEEKNYYFCHDEKKSFSIFSCGLEEEEVIFSSR
jgi:hypothetical protein